MSACQKRSELVTQQVYGAGGAHPPLLPWELGGARCSSTARQLPSSPEPLYRFRILKITQYGVTFSLHYWVTTGSSFDTWDAQEKTGGVGVSVSVNVRSGGHEWLEEG